MEKGTEAERTKRGIIDRFARIFNTVRKITAIGKEEKEAPLLVSLPSLRKLYISRFNSM